MKRIRLAWLCARAVAAGACAAVLVGSPAAAGVIGSAETDASGRPGFCVELEGADADAGRAGNYLLAPGASPGIAPTLRTRAPADGLGDASGGCMVAEEPVLQDLADLETFAPDTVIPTDIRSAMTDVPLLPEPTGSRLGQDATWQSGDSLFAALSDYVSVVPAEAEGAAEREAAADREGAAGPQDDLPALDLFGLRDGLLAEMLDRSLLRELLVDVLSPAIGTEDDRSFSVLGVGEFRLEYNQGTQSLQLVETGTDISVALTSGNASSRGGGVAVRFGGSGGGSGGGSSGGGAPSPMSPEEMAAHIVLQLLTSVWFYLCLLLGLGTLAYVKFRRLTV